MRVEGHVGRQAQIGQHVRNLSSPNPRVAKTAAGHLKRMNASWDERFTALAKAGKNPYVHTKPVAAMPISEDRPVKDISAPTPILGTKPKNIGRQQKRLKHVLKGYQRNQAQLDAMVNPLSHENLQYMAEGLTGYHEIRHIGSHPLAGGIALAGILPFGRAAHVLEAARGAEEGAQAARVAKAAEKASQLSGVRGVLASKKAERLALKAARRGAKRTSEQANAHVLAAARIARSQDFGRILPKTPILKPGEITAETGGKAGAIIRRGLNPDFKGLGPYEKVGAKLDNPGVAELRKQQDLLRHAELSKKAGALQAAHDAAKSWEDLGKAGAARAGELTHGGFHGFDGLEEHLAELHPFVQQADLQPFERARLVDAVNKGIEGDVPTEGEQKLLEGIFGKERVPGIMADLKRAGTMKAIASVANIPRAIMAAGDLSAPFRQGLVVMASHPGIFFKGFGPMLHAAVSEEYYHAAMEALHSSPEFPLMEKGGVPFTEISDTAKSAVDVNKKEEQYATNLAQRIPILGHLIRGSDRAYTLFLNLMRAKVFTHLVHQAAENGWHLVGSQGDKLLKDIGKFVGSATGRGDLGSWTQHTAFLNSAFFSPRLMASRFNFLNPAYYIRMEPFARQQALRAALRLAGTLNLVLFLAKMEGAKVVTDPRNADFGKIRIGNTRLDLAGGFTQPIRLISQIYTGQVISSTSGKVENLSGSGFGRNRLDVVGQFLENKAAPVPSAVIDALKGGQFGQKYNWKSQATQRMIPLLWQDLAQIYHSTGAKGVAGYGLPDLFGVGVQNYSAKPPKSRSGSGFGGGGSSSFGGGSGSSFP